MTLFEKVEELLNKGYTVELQPSLNVVYIVLGRVYKKDFLTLSIVHITEEKIVDCLEILQEKVK